MFRSIKVGMAPENKSQEHGRRNSSSLQNNQKTNPLLSRFYHTLGKKQEKIIKFERILR